MLIKATGTYCFASFAWLHSSNDKQHFVCLYQGEKASGAFIFTASHNPGGHREVMKLAMYNFERRIEIYFASNFYCL